MVDTRALAAVASMSLTACSLSLSLADHREARAAQQEEGVQARAKYQKQASPRRPRPRRAFSLSEPRRTAPCRKRDPDQVYDDIEKEEATGQKTAFEWDDDLPGALARA